MRLLWDRVPLKTKVPTTLPFCQKKAVMKVFDNQYREITYAKNFPGLWSPLYRSSLSIEIHLPIPRFLLLRPVSPPLRFLMEELRAIS